MHILKKHCSIYKVLKRISHYFIKQSYVCGLDIDIDFMHEKWIICIVKFVEEWLVGGPRQSGEQVSQLKIGRCEHSWPYK